MLDGRDEILNILEVLKKEKRFVGHDEFKRPINPNSRFARNTVTMLETVRELK